MSFRLIPDEGEKSGNLPHFTTRKIRKSKNSNLFNKIQKGLVRFEDEGTEMLISEMGDLVDSLYEMALVIQRTKQAVLLQRLRKSLRKKISHG